MYNPYIVGKKVYLRHPTEEDVKGDWHEWFSDEETTKYLIVRYWPNSLEQQLDFYKSLKDNRNRMVLSIVSKEDDSHIGVLGINNINWVQRYAEGSIVIGSKAHRKAQFTIDATDLLHRVAFQRLNLLNLLSYHVSTNDGALVIQELFKYEKIGEFSNLLLIDGEKCDLVASSISKEIWSKEMGE